MYAQPNYQQAPGGPRVHDMSATEASEFLTKVYGWMSFGLFVTAGVSLLLSAFPGLIVSLVHSGLFYVLLFGELGLVWYLSARIAKMDPATASALFFAYSALNGVTISIIFLIYTSASIASTFVLCAATFGAMSAYGYTTKTDLSTMGSFLMMALIGLIIASMVNLFLLSPAIYWLTTYAGILIFVGLTAWDTQKIKNMAQGQFGDEAMASKASIMGALILYLDFINLFLYLLRLFGSRRRD